MFYILDLVTQKIEKMQTRSNSNALMLVSHANSANEARQWVANGSYNRNKVARE
jgi:hypothetical protein